MAENIVIDFVSDTKALDTAIAKVERLSAADKKAGEQFRQTNNIFNQTNNTLHQTNNTLNQTNISFTQIINQSKKTGEAFEKMGSKSKAVSGDLDKLTNTLKNVAGAVGVAFGLQQMIAFGVESVKLKAKMESLQNTFNFAFGSVAEGGRAMKFIRDLSEELGLELISTASAFKGFAASANLSGIKSDETKKIFRQMSLAVTALGLSAEDANGTFLALSQIISKGTVQAEELRGQIGERIPGAFNLAAKAMGVTTQELNKMLEQGQVLSVDFLPKFAQEMENTFASAIPAAVDSTQAKLNRISNWFTDLRVSTGVALVDLVDFFDKAGDKAEEFALRAGFGDEIHKDRDKIQKEKTEAWAKGAAARKVIQIKEVKDEIQIFKDDLNAIEKERKKAGANQKQLDELELANKREIAALEIDLEKLTGTAAIAVKKGLTKKEQDALDKAIKERQDALEEEAKHKQDILNKELRDNEKKFDTLNKLKLEAIKISQEGELIGVEKGGEEEAELRIKHIEEIRDFKIATEVEFHAEQLNLENKAQNDILELKEKFDEQWFEEKAKNDEEEYKRQQKAREENDDLLNKQAEARVQAEIDLAFSLFNAIGSLSEQETTLRIESLEEQLELGQITQAQFEEQEKEIKRKAANRDKLLSLFNIGLKTAEGVINYLSNPVTAPLVPFVIATGAIQAGVVAAQPIPFAKGTKSVTGGEEGKDSVHALVMPGEMIIPTNTKKRYQPILNAIFDEKISPDILNNLVLGQQMRQGQQKGIDEYDLSNGMKRALRDGVHIKNMPKQSGISASEIDLLIRRGVIVR